MGDFEGKVLVVTGSATGLGAAIAKGAAARGARAIVLNCTKSLAEAEATAAEIRALGAEAVIAQGDVADDAACRAIAAAAAPYGRIDALVNNAGITKHVPNHADMDGLAAEDFQRLYAVNVVGPFQMTRAARSLLEAAPRASVLMVSSIAGVTGIGSSVAYAATKGALNTMTLSLARALAPKIRVNALCPGYIDTEINHHHWQTEQGKKLVQMLPRKRVGQVQDLDAVLVMLCANESHFINGAVISADDGAGV
jgi:NAD(P)-dependent dehydrogenase (short-subunit alcohol dehydrogenase family)